jgi:hypothetical protein
MGVNVFAGGGVNVFVGGTTGVFVFVGGICRRGAAVAPPVLSGKAANTITSINAPSRVMRVRHVIMSAPVKKRSAATD